MSLLVPAVLLTVASALGSSAAAAALQQEAGADDLLIENVTVISPDRAAPLIRQWLHVQNGRIVGLSGKPIPVPAGTARLDGNGKYLTPGLIDSHVHLYHATGLKRRYSKDFASLYDGYMAQMPRSYLYHGYTSLIELNADFETNSRVNASALKPDVYHCGQGLVLSNDFMATDFDSAEDFFAAYPNFLHDRYTTPKLPAGFDPAEHTPAATVARIAKDGGRCVKLYYEEALWWPGERPDFALPSEVIVKEVVSEAHKRGMTVLLHGTTPNAQRLALATGIDVLAHGLWEWPGSRLDQTEPSAAINTLTDTVARSPLQLQPTMQTLRNELSLTRSDFLDQPALTKVLPAAYLHYLRTDAQVQRQELRRRAERIAPNLFPELDMQHFDLPKLQQQYLGRYEKLVGKFQQRGGKLLFGTDTAVGGLGWGNPPGLNGLWEMRAWQQAGISLPTILHAATLGNAKAFGLDAELGTVTVGKRANLLLLNANPLASVEAWDKIDTVILHGERIARQTLAADALHVAVTDIAIAPTADRPGFRARLWYPTTDQTLQTFGASRIRDGYQAVLNGRYISTDQRSGNKAPLIVLNHGSGGSADSMAWLAQGLVEQGVIVIAADHPASTGGDSERASILELWQQPLDVRQLLDQLLDGKSQPDWAARIDRNRIGAIGFSLGGSTVLSLAGVQFELERFFTFCKQHDDGACRAFSPHLPQLGAEHFQRSNANYREPRIKAAVAIAPGFTETMTPASLHALTTPVLLLAAAQDQQLPPASHIHPIRAQLPAAMQYVELPESHHFSLLPLCNDKAAVVLAESHEEFVCEEVGHKSRAQIHADALAQIRQFLQAQQLIR